MVPMVFFQDCSDIVRKINHIIRCVNHHFHDVKSIIIVITIFEGGHMLEVIALSFLLVRIREIYKQMRRLKISCPYSDDSKNCLNQRCFVSISVKTILIFPKKNFLDFSTDGGGGHFKP